MRTTRSLAAGFRFQLSATWRSPRDLLVLINAPFLTIVLMAVLRQAGRSDLSSYAVLAPAVMALWAGSLSLGSQMIERDRWSGTLELMIAAPASLPPNLFGRLLGTSLINLAAFVESVVVARVGFGYHLTLDHPVVLALGLLATSVAMAGTAVALSGAFVLSGSPRQLQGALNYPFYVLGGVMVPVSLFPVWLRIPSRLFFLSWSTDLLRDALAHGPVRSAGLRLAAILGTGAVWYLIGAAAVSRIVHRLRATGTVRSP